MAAIPLLSRVSARIQPSVDLVGEIIVRLESWPLSLLLPVLLQGEPYLSPLTAEWEWGLSLEQHWQEEREGAPEEEKGHTREARSCDAPERRDHLA